MKTDNLKSHFETIGFKFMGITFLEDGYEVRFKLEEKTFEDGAEYDRYIEAATDKICNLKVPGFVVSEVIIDGGMYLLTLVPKTLDEMTDFIWKYVEKYGRREERLADILRDAFCAMEIAIDNIPDRYEGKNEAKTNFENFASMIF